MWKWLHVAVCYVCWQNADTDWAPDGNHLFFNASSAADNTFDFSLYSQQVHGTERHRFKKGFKANEWCADGIWQWMFVVSCWVFLWNRECIQHGVCCKIFKRAGVNTAEEELWAFLFFCLSEAAQSEGSGRVDGEFLSSTRCNGGAKTINHWLPQSFE